ncbi:hypothetical protein LJC44_07110 [Parabacteroides sp. OttesenSCG-928-G06]|nr:hypothetical protein [Parabacteroides sp. OttesenSCG-928-K15]MDL2282846.1 hypothetical protein [Parabacteroides sp. OttesenSCG-928-G06]
MKLFDIKRVGLILRTDWIMHKKQFFLVAGLLLVSFLFLLWEASRQQQMAVFGFGLPITLYVYLKYIGKKIHYSKGLWLTLPATTLEKYVALLLIGVVYIAVFFFAYFFSLEVCHSLNEMVRIPLEGYSVPTIGFGVILFHLAYYFLAFVIFRTFAFGIAWLVEMGVIWLLALLVLLSKDSWVSMYSSILPFNILEPIADHLNIISYALAIILFYVAYLRLKKQQLR